MDNLESPKSMLEFRLGLFLGILQEMFEDPAADDDDVYDNNYSDIEEMMLEWRKKYKEEIAIVTGGSNENTRNWF